MSRAALSKPISLALQDGVLTQGQSVFDYGCGRGGDIERLAQLGYNVSGWDPGHAADQSLLEADVVNCGYVINVIEDVAERHAALQKAWDLTQKVLIVAARPDYEAASAEGRRFGDGVVTSAGTFQKFFGQDELKAVIERAANGSVVAAAPGIFYVFRDPSLAQGLLARRFRRRAPAVRRPRISERLYDEHKDLLDPIVDFVLVRGRLPEIWELARGSDIKSEFGTIRAALAIVRRVAGDEGWAEARKTAQADLAVYVALSAFGGRPKFSGLPEDVQLDVKALFGSYKDACLEADALLFSLGDQSTVAKACNTSLIGKQTPDALYVHRSYVTSLDPVLRLYEGCGRALTGDVEEATLVKLNKIEAKVSYLAYPDFDRDPHPALRLSLRADLRKLHVKYRDFTNSENPPVLHRKETFVGSDYPAYAKFSKLTAQEVRAGLLEDAATIGTRRGWKDRLDGTGYLVRGHKLERHTPNGFP